MNTKDLLERIRLVETEIDYLKYKVIPTIQTMLIDLRHDLKEDEESMLNDLEKEHAKGE